LQAKGKKIIAGPLFCQELIDQTLVVDHIVVGDAEGSSQLLVVQRLRPAVYTCDAFPAMGNSSAVWSLVTTTMVVNLQFVRGCHSM
jgi:hypothetical protein